MIDSIDRPVPRGRAQFGDVTRSETVLILVQVGRKAGVAPEVDQARTFPRIDQVATRPGDRTAGRVGGPKQR